ncbi:MAG: hypothetical protein ACMUIE_09820 [Thermoplasmatota archaeon]
MVDDKKAELPRGLIKNLFTALMVAGILLYVPWQIYLIAVKNIWFDIGLYSLCVIMILMGLTGRLVYGYEAKLESQ